MNNRPTVETVARNANLLPSSIRLSEEVRGRQTQNVRLVAKNDETPIFFLIERRHEIKDGGCFYRASLESNGQVSLAVKCVRIEHAADLNNEIRIERYLRQDNNNHALQHYAILPHDVYTNRKQADTHADETYYFVTSRLASEGDLLEAIYLDPRDIVADVGIRRHEMNCKRYFQQIAKAVKFLHDRNIYHCDLKPDNIAVHVENEQTHSYIIDFGKATVENAEVIAYRQYGTSAYAPANLGPLHQGTNNFFDWRKADIWALGITLYSMLLGRMPPWHNQTVVLADNKYFVAISKNGGIAGFLRHNRRALDLGEGEWFSDNAMNLLQEMLLEEPADRISINDILNHPWFNQE